MVDIGLVTFAFGLGTATFFAPCAFPLLPGYVAYFLGRDDESVADTWPARMRRAVTVSLVTSLGFLVVFGALAVVVFTLGTQVLGDIAVLEVVAGTVLVVLGAVMASGKTTGAVAHVRLPERRRGPVGFFGFGVVYAAAAAGCTGPLFVGVASLALTGGANPVTTFGAYAAGMVVLLVGVTVLTALGKDTVLERLTANTRLVTRLAGAALVVAGFVQIYWFLFVFDGLSQF
jgi:cytochrome c-type biogenesis protein